MLCVLLLPLLPRLPACVCVAQIFDFLDVNGLGSIDLVAIMGEAHEWLDDLDDEVRTRVCVCVC